MTSFKTIPNHAHKVRFSGKKLNSHLLTNFNLDTILDQALQNTSAYLRQFRFDAGYTTKLETAFGNDFNRSVANQIFDKLAQGDFSGIPTIEIVNRNDINGANGAFAVATGKIYLSQEFITANAQNINAIVSVLLEEYGHYVDSRINTKDAAGDEGDIFARLVQGKSISQQELAVLRAEDDSATVTLDGQAVEIEENSNSVVKIFEHGSYTGAYHEFSLGNYNVPSWWDNLASSIEIPTGWSVRLYENYNYQGRYRDLNNSSGWLNDFNDLTSSIQVIQGESVEIFQHGSFGGNSFRLTPGKYNFDQLGSVGNEGLSSLKVPAGFSVRLYEHGNYQGKRKVFNSGNYSWVGDDFNDQTSSIDVLSPAEIFQHGNYGGNSFKLAPGKYNITQLGSVGNDQLSSLKVPQGLSVVLYKDPNFQGESKVFNSGNHSRVGDDFNDQTSSIEVRVVLSGTSQNDTFIGGDGSDVIDGGAGIDTFDISQEVTSYEVRLDGQNKGNASSTSSKHELFSIENVIGSNFNDSLYGDGLANRLEGNGGNDLIEGRSGNDILSGGLGNDTLDGGTESDRAIETGDVNFTLSIVNIANDTNNTHQLTGLGTDTLRNIETVELQGGASNNTLDAGLATVKVKLEGLGGHDTLKGGSGDDTLIGGKGSNNLWGGKGRDTFVIDRSSTSLYSGDIQIIQDFERTVDSIDIAGAELRSITFERNTVENYTLIKENGVDRAKVMGNTRIDSTDLSAFRTIYQPLPANEVGNLDQVIRKWAQNYATYIGTTLVNDNVSLAGVKLTQGEVKYNSLTSINLPNGDIDIVIMGTHTNKTDLQQPSPTYKYTQRASATSNVTVGTSYSQTNTTAIKHGWKIGVGFDYNLTTKVSSKVSAKVGDIGGEAGAETGTSTTFKFSSEYSGEYSSTGSFTNGGSKTYSDIKLVEKSLETTYPSQNVSALSVTEFQAISLKKTYSGKYEMDVAIEGNVAFRLADDGKTSNGINPQDVVIPVALILEQYNPEIFYSQDTNYQTYTLLNGDQIVYNPNLKFNVKGTIESQSIYDTKVVVDTTYDILLGGLQNYQAQGGKERLWVATGQLPLAGTAPVKITGFSDGRDKIGFANVPQVMGLGSLERWDSGTSGFIGIGTGDQRRALAELVGISATALDASDFIFNTTGTAIA